MFDVQHLSKSFVHKRKDYTNCINLQELPKLGQCKARPFYFSPSVFVSIYVSISLSISLSTSWGSALCSSSTGHCQHLLANVTYMVYLSLKFKDFSTMSRACLKFKNVATLPAVPLVLISFCVNFSENESNLYVQLILNGLITG